jgi:nucleotide-binding universal stress UspA family protein
MNKILVGTDFSDSSRRALNYAVDLAEKYAASITVLNVVYPPTSEAPADIEYPMPWIENFSADWKKYNEQVLIKLVDKTKEHKPNLAISSMIREGQPAPQIIEAAKDFDLIVLGQKGRTMPDSLIGSISGKVAAFSKRPIIIVP